jgi:hypothetical protein
VLLLWPINNVSTAISYTVTTLFISFTFHILHIFIFFFFAFLQHEDENIKRGGWKQMEEKLIIVTCR